MKTTSQRLAPIGLLLAALALLSALIMFFLEKEFGIWSQVSLGVCVIGLAAAILLDPEKARLLLTGRQMRYGSNMLVLSIAIIGILIVVNILIFRTGIRWDLTTDRENTLTSDTTQLLEQLEKPVHAQAFFTSRTPTDTVQILLEAYQAESQGKFSYEFIDPEQNIVAAESARITRDGTIVLQLDERQEKVNAVSEEELSSAIMRLLNPGTRVVYFLTGHGEYDPDATEQNAYSFTRQALESKNYTIKKINLLAETVIPDDAVLLIIAGPQKPLIESEIAAIRAYQEKGGTLVLLAEPVPSMQLEGEPDLLMNYAQDFWQIELSNDLILDLSSSSPLLAVANEYRDHPITQKMNNTAVVLPGARSLIEPPAAPAGKTYTALALTSANAWGETNFETLETSPAFEQDSDLPGPLELAIAAEDENTKARFVVVGDSDFASDSYYRNLGNSNFIENIVDWAARQDNLISISPRPRTERVLLPPNQLLIALSLVVSVFLLPGLVVIAGLLVLFSRKRRG